MRALLLTTICVLAGIRIAWAEADPKAGKLPPTTSKVSYRCSKIANSAITIDGNLDEPVWRQAPVMTNFGVVRTDGQRAKLITVARLLWDDKNLYASFECANDGIRSEATERDQPVWEGEAAELFLCPGGADAIYYEFNFSPKNVIYDSRVESWKYEDQVKNWRKWAKGFNAALKSATQVHRDAAGNVTGWSVEAAIPFQDLDVAGSKAPHVGDVWLFNAFRVAVRKDNSQELSHWQPVKPEFHRPHQFPRLEFAGKE